MGIQEERNLATTEMWPSPGSAPRALTRPAESECDVEGPENIHATDSTEGGGTASLTFTVSATRAVNVDTVQK